MEKQKQFIVEIDSGKTTEEMVRLGNYNSSHELIGSEHFSIRPEAKGRRIIEMVELDSFYCTGQVLEKGMSRRLVQPRHEDVLFFGAQHQELQGIFIFLHENPLEVSWGLSYYLAIYNSPSDRRLLLLQNGMWGGWDIESGIKPLFAFVR